MRTTKPKIPAAVLVGIIGALTLMLGGAVLDGAPIGGFFNIAAICIVGGGTLGATLAHTGIDAFLQIPAGMKFVIASPAPDWEAMAVELVRAADLVHHSDGNGGGGLLALETEAASAEDPFMRIAHQAVADATDEKAVAQVLYSYVDSEHQTVRHQADLFATAGGYSPTMGIIGTVMGLTHALSLLNEPSQLGPAIASAFMATFYGVSSANVALLPIGNRLFGLGRERESYRELQIAGIMAISAGEPARGLADHLAAMLPDTAITGEDIIALARNTRSPTTAPEAESE